MTIFDIEVGPLSDAELEAVKPEFKAPKNYKDPLKIAAAVAEAEAEWKASAALDAKTATILAIGLLDAEGERILTETEAGMLEYFWAVWDEGERMVGFACKNYDMVMAWQRSIILGVTVPIDVLQSRYWNPRVIDLQEVWTCYSRDIKGQNLDAICKALKIPGKLPGMTGADFARVFAEDRERALAYLRADLAATAALAARLGVS